MAVARRVAQSSKSHPKDQLVHAWHPPPHVRDLMLDLAQASFVRAATAAVLSANAEPWNAHQRKSTEHRVGPQPLGERPLMMGTSTSRKARTPSRTKGGLPTQAPQLRGCCSTPGKKDAGRWPRNCGQCLRCWAIENACHDAHPIHRYALLQVFQERAPFHRPS